MMGTILPSGGEPIGENGGNFMQCNVIMARLPRRAAFHTAEVGQLRITFTRIVGDAPIPGGKGGETPPHM
jgi:hypothetical protein